MTRNLWIIYSNNDVALMYANGITVHPIDINDREMRTCKEVSDYLLQAGYTEPGTRCNPEMLDYAVIVTEWKEGLLFFEGKAEL